MSIEQPDSSDLSAHAPAYNLEEMPTPSILSLHEALQAELAASISEGQFTDARIGEFEQDLSCLPTRNLPKAREVFTALARSAIMENRSTAASYIGSLLQAEEACGEVPDQRKVIGLWARLVADQEWEVSHSAQETLDDSIRGQRLTPPTLAWLTGEIVDTLVSIVENQRR